VYRDGSPGPDEPPSLRTEKAAPASRLILTSDLVQHLFLHEDRNLGVAGHRNRVARPAVDLQRVAVSLDNQLGVKRVVFQLVHHHVLDLPTHRVDDVYQQVVRHGPRGLKVPHLAVDHRGLEDTDHDRKSTRSAFFFEENVLLITVLMNDDLVEGHPHHGGCSPLRRTSTIQLGRHSCTLGTTPDSTQTDRTIHPTKPPFLPGFLESCVLESWSRSPVPCGGFFDLVFPTVQFILSRADRNYPAHG
jgi:hypothetical protein